MHWKLKAVSILDQRSDVLICSANPHLTLEEFGSGIAMLTGRDYPSIETVIMCLREDYRIGELASAIPEATID